MSALRAAKDMVQHSTVARGAWAWSSQIFAFEGVDQGAAMCDSLISPARGQRQRFGGLSDENAISGHVERDARGGAARVRSEELSA